MSDTNAWEYRRIDTLIPYKEPSWSPAEDTRLPRLSSKAKSWTMCAKLGKYLLSSTRDQDEVAEIAAGAYRRIFAIGDPVISRVESPEPGSYAAQVLREIKGPHPMVLEADGEDRFGKGGPTTILTSATDFGERFKGVHCFTWRGGSHPTVGFRLDSAVGILALVDVMPREELIEETIRRGRVAIETERALVSGMMSTWKKNDDGMYVDPSAAERGEIHTVNLRWRLESLTGKTERLLEITSDRDTFDRELRKAIQALLDTRDRAKYGAFERYWQLGPALTAMEKRFWNEESNRDLNRRYAREQEREHTATVWQYKKNIDPAHVAMASSGYIGNAFREVEVDDSVDLGEYDQLQGELLRRFAAREIPQVDCARVGLRFRLCGRHRAWGLYSPLRNTVVVDPRHPVSLLHEFAHAYDFGHGQLSCGSDFAPIVRAVREGLRGTGIKKSLFDYAVTPTEVFARAWEVYASEAGLGGSFVRVPRDYEDDPIYVPLLDCSDRVFDYFERMLPEGERPIPIELDDPERVEQRAKAALDDVLPNLGHDWGGERGCEGAAVTEQSWEAASRGQQFSLF